jgi:O-acetyl-ADP-ribose deacetylase (regulator of RNase III)
VADEHALTSLAFPAISTGIYGYPAEEAAQVAVAAVIDALRTTVDVKLVRFILFDSATLLAFVRTAEELQNNNPQTIKARKGNP